MPVRLSGLCKKHMPTLTLTATNQTAGPLAKISLGIVIIFPKRRTQNLDNSNIKKLIKWSRKTILLLQL
jgi:hypothetical protein